MEWNKRKQAVRLWNFQSWQHISGVLRNSLCWTGFESDCISAKDTNFSANDHWQKQVIMNFDFFFKFAKFRVGNLVSAEDYSDKFHFQITNIILMVFVVLVGVRQYVFTPIQCWIPHEWSRGWEEYAENWCWVQDTYFGSIENGPPEAKADRSATKISKFLWLIAIS